MALRKIFMGDAPCLRKVCRPVENFDKGLLTLLDDMAETMYDAEGVGLAAPQVGVLKRVVVIDCGDGLYEFINPKIVSYSGEQGGMEGCLSLPNQKGYVVRPNKAIVRAFNRKGQLMEYTCEGLFTRAVFHELDHLDGKLYTDFVTEPPTDFNEDEVE